MEAASSAVEGSVVDRTAGSVMVWMAGGQSLLGASSPPKM